MQIKRMLAVLAVAAFVNGNVVADAKPAAQEPKKEESKKANTAAVVKDVNTNITLGDVVSKDVKVDLTMRCMNFMETVQNYKKGAELSEGIEKKRQKLAENIKQEEQKLTQTMTEFKTKEATMSTSARNNLESQIVKMRRDYESLVKSSEDELKLAMNQATEELSADVEKTVAEIAKAKGYDLVVDTYSGRVVFASDKAMITNDLVKAMDKKYEVASNKKSTPKPAATAA
jgi:Skp family chaperone for outer membrane proteins